MAGRGSTLAGLAGAGLTGWMAGSMYRKNTNDPNQSTPVADPGVIPVPDPALQPAALPDTPGVIPVPDSSLLASDAPAAAMPARKKPASASKPAAPAKILDYRDDAARMLGRAPAPVAGNMSDAPRGVIPSGGATVPGRNPAASLLLKTPVTSQGALGQVRWAQGSRLARETGQVPQVPAPVVVAPPPAPAPRPLPMQLPQGVVPAGRGTLQQAVTGYADGGKVGGNAPGCSPRSFPKKGR